MSKRQQKKGSLEQQGQQANQQRPRNASEVEPPSQGSSRGNKGSRQGQQQRQAGQAEGQKPQQSRQEQPCSQPQQGAGGNEPVKALAELESDVSSLSLTQGDSSSVEPIWNKSACGSFNNPFPTLEARRKASGTKGRKTKLFANHFPLKVLCEQVYRYDVTFKVADWKRDVQKRDKPMLIRAIELLKKQFAGKVFPPEKGGESLVVFDGMSAIFSAKQLKIADNAALEATVSTHTVEDEKKVVAIKVRISFNSTFPLKAALDAFLARGQGREVQPLQAVQILNIILSYAVNVDPSKYISIGRKCFSQEKGHIQQIDAGKFLWLGTFESVRVGWKLTLNVDMANKPAYEKDELINFIGNYLHSQRKRNDDIPALINLLRKDRSAVDMVNKEIRDLKARFLRPDGAKRDYRMLKLFDPPSQVTMDKNGKKITIAEYFLEEYNYRLKHPELPCVQVGNPKNKIYIPMELLELKKQSCPQSKMLGEDATRAMIKITAVKPNERQSRIKAALKSRNDNLQKDPYAIGFGITMQDQFASIEGRVLDPPQLKYEKVQKGGPVETMPRDGKWTMPQKSTFTAAKDLVNWGVLNRSRMSYQDVEVFINAILYEASAMGMKAERPKEILQSTQHLEKDLRAMHKRLPSPASIIMVITPFKQGDDYSTVKLLGDSELNLPTQFVLEKNVRSKAPATIHNIVLKLNSKLGGTNQVLSPLNRGEILSGSIPLLTKPIMIMGADVTHPAPGLQDVKPSIAAVVASFDPSVSQYNTEVRVQWGKVGQASVEQIMDMEGLTRNLLMKFYNANRGKKPERIIMYRDGVSEGQFELVVNKELAAMQRACCSLEKDYQPGITYFVAQKRHHTRLFPQDPKNGLRNGNVPPGTVVDVDITYPTVASFFLASHEGIQGTTKPTYYVKLSDDNNLSPDAEQALTYFLCHLYSRCERSVSYPAPTYYAHLAAFRAREHHNALLSKFGDKVPKEEILKMQQMNVINYFV